MASGNPCPLDPVPSEDEVAEGLKKQEQKNAESVQYVHASNKIKIYFCWVTLHAV